MKYTRIWFTYDNSCHAQCSAVLEYIYSSLLIATFRKDKQMCFSTVSSDLVVTYFVKHLFVTSEIQNVIKCSKDVYINCAPSAIFCNFCDFYKIFILSSIDRLNRILTRVANIYVFNTLLKGVALETAL